jgi:prephenate dehydrogenase
MNDLKQITVVGLGLIGGSMALALRKITGAKIVGNDNNPLHVEKALELGIIDATSSLADINQSDVVVIAVPVNKIAQITAEVLGHIHENAFVFDTGSIKRSICVALKNHPKRENFIAAHPIAGTEFSGPEAAFETLFEGKKNIICDAKYSRPDLLEKALALFDKLNMKTDQMRSIEHDKHIAYVSHLSHISSFMLGKTVMEIEKDEENIFNMAGSGFESTVRLAKSSPETWTPIFIENKQSIMKSLDEYMKNLKDFSELIANDNFDEIYKVMKKVNHIKKILKEKSS